MMVVIDFITGQNWFIKFRQGPLEELKVLKPLI